MARVRGVLAVGIVLLFALVPASALATTPQPGAPRATGYAYAKVRNGESSQRVVALLGRNFTVCSTCARLTWVYLTGLGDPVAIAVRFKHGTVASHFLIRPQPDF